MKRLLTITFVFIIMLSLTDSYSNGLSLNSPGPKGLAMGGAMIGLADDYTALYWNPAGLSNMKTSTLSAFITDVVPVGTYKVNFPEAMGGAKIDATTETNHYINPSLFYYKPLMSGDLNVGIGVYVPAGLGAQWNGADLTAFSGPAGTAFKWSNEIGVLNISPGASYKINDMLQVGAAVNVYYAMLDMQRPMDMLDAISQPGQIIPGEDGMMDTQYQESSTGLGVGATVGILFKPIDMLSIGLSFRTQTSVFMEGDGESSTIAALGLPAETPIQRDLLWPMWIGGGIAVKPTDELTVCFDAQWSQWSASQKEIVTVYDLWIDPTTAEPMEETMEMLWEDALQLRLGLQYEFTSNFALRAGVYTDPAPAPDETLNIIFPSISYTGFTVGCGLRMDNVTVDFGVEYLMGEDREISWEYFAQHPHSMPGTHGMNILAASLGMTYYFVCDEE